MIEKNIRNCKNCKLPKQRILNGKFPNGKDNCWIDEKEKQWNGKVCPDCNVQRCKSTMQKIRSVKNEKK
jgi:hypothetical protein